MEKFNNKGVEAYLCIKKFNSDTFIKRNIIARHGRSLEKGIEKAESNLLNKEVEYAFYKENGSIIHYYHHKLGIRVRLTKETYKNCFKKSYYSLWIMPTTKARIEGMKAFRINNVSKEDIRKHYTKDVSKIMIYHYGQYIASIKDGKFILKNN